MCFGISFSKEFIVALDHYQARANSNFKVDLSIDGGKTWTQAELKKGSNQPYGRAWAWTLWEGKIAVPAHLRQANQEIEVCCRAVDHSFNQQPERPDLVWSLRGIMNNSWHRIKLRVSDEA